MHTSPRSSRPLGSHRPAVSPVCSRPWTHLTLEAGGAVSPCRACWVRVPLGHAGRELDELWGADPHRAMLAAHLRGDWWESCNGRCPTLCLPVGEDLGERRSGDGGPLWPDRVFAPELGAGPRVLRLERMPGSLDRLTPWLQGLERLEIEVNRRGLGCDDLAFGLGPWLARSTTASLTVAVEVAESMAGSSFESAILRLCPRPSHLTVWLRGGGGRWRSRRRLWAMSALARHGGAALELGWTLGDGPPGTVIELGRMAGRLGCGWKIRRGWGQRFDPIGRRHHAYLERLLELLERTPEVVAGWNAENRRMWDAEPLLARLPRPAIGSAEVICGRPRRGRDALVRLVPGKARDRLDVGGSDGPA